MAEVLTKESKTKMRVGQMTNEQKIDPSQAVNQEEFYKKVFSPDSIHQQIIRLCSILGIKQPTLGSIANTPSFPKDENVTGFAVVVDYRFIDPEKNDYSRSVLKILKMISKQGHHIENSLAGRIGDNIEIGSLTKMCLDMCPNFGPFRIFPIQTGHKWSGCSAYEANRKLNESAKDSGWIEFPLSLFDCLCLFVTHPDRMLQRDGVLPECSGDVFNPGSDGSSFFIPRFEFDNCRTLVASYNQKVPSGIKTGRHSTWTGYVKR